MNKHGGQLFRYFATTTAKFGILTNGFVYQFYTDLEELNKMDKAPFLIVNLMSLKDGVIPYLQQFEKSTFDVGKVTDRANELRYSDRVRDFLLKQLKEPDDTFVAHILTDIYKGRKTQRVIEDFRPIVKNAFTQIINDKANERLKSAMDTEIKPPEIQSEPADDSPNMEHVEFFFTVKALLHDCIGERNLTFEDSENQIEILADEKWLCRFDYTANSLQINLKSGEKNSIKRHLRSQEDIHFYKNLLSQAVQA